MSLSEDLLVKLKAKATLVLEKNGDVVVDERTATLLALIDRFGSILAAARALGLAYSRAWDAIARIERNLGVKIVEVKRGGRGGGGAKLTSEGKRLLELYAEEYMKNLRKPLLVPSLGFKVPALVYAGSHDLLVERIFGSLRDESLENIEMAWVGSSGGLALLMLGEADIAGVHLYDPSTERYNTPYLSRYWLEDKVVMVRGYDREVGFAMRSYVDDPLEGLLRGELRLVNRNIGSGTRVLLDYLLERKAIEKNLGIEEVKKVKGYNVEVKTHMDVVKAIAQGEADVGLTTYWAAKQYGLKFKHVTWERFDFIITRSSLERNEVKRFISFLSTDKIREIAEAIGGYIIPSDSGKIIKD